VVKFMFIPMKKHRNIPLFFILFFTLFLSQISFSQSWEQTYNKAQSYYEKDWQESARLLEQALELIRAEDGKNKQYANILNDIGLAYWHLGDFEKAKDRFQETISLKRELYDGQGNEYAASLVNIAGLYQNMGNLNKARDLYEEAIAVYNSSEEKNEADYAAALNNYGNLYATAGAYARTEELYLEALAIRKNLLGEDHPDYGATLNNLGKLYIKINNFSKAEELLSQAATIYVHDLSNYRNEYANTLDNLGRLYEVKGNYGEAERIFLEAAKIRKALKGEQQKEYAKSLNNLGSLYRKLGNFSNAVDYFKQSLEIYRNSLSDQHPDYATVANNLAALYKLSGDLKKAEGLYEQAADIWLKAYGEFNPRYATAINNLASLYRLQNKYEEALELYLKVLEIDRRTVGEKHPIYATSLANLAVLYSAMGNLSKAEPLYKQSLVIRKEALGENHPAYAKALNNLALFYMLKGYLDEAEPFFRRAIQVQLKVIEELFPSLSEKEKEDYYNTIKLDQERFNTIGMRRKDVNPSIVEEMYNHQLATKAILFNATDKMRRNILKSGDQQLIDNFQRWRRLKSDLATYYRMSKAQLEEKNIDITEIEQNANQLEKSLSLQSKYFENETGKQRHTWQEIQKVLKEGEAAIELIRFREYTYQTAQNQEIEEISFGFTDNVHYAALIITSKTQTYPKFVLLENGNELEHKYLANYKNSLKFRIKDLYSYEQYWNPIRKAIPDIEKVYISPDGIYNMLNLNVFYNTEKNRYLIDETDVVLLTSTKDLLSQSEDEVVAKTAVMFGNPEYTADEEQRYQLIHNQNFEIDPNRKKIDVTKIKYSDRYFSDLPGAKEEIMLINSITQQKDWQNKAFLGPNALEEVLKAIYNPKVLHIATHGFFSENVGAVNNDYGVSPQNPLFTSGLMFSGSGYTVLTRRQGGTETHKVEDGILTAYEAMNLNLDKTDLVVLSACETGLGEVNSGEGVYGLERAFKVAGAKAIIMSLIKVEDQATKELMTLFYEQWIKLGDKRKAFKKAQLLFRENNPDPYKWGAFVMVGT